MDAFLLAKMQRFCDCFTEWTGLTKFKITKWCAIFMASALGIFGFALFGPSGAIVLVVISVAVVGLVWIIEFSEREFLSSGTILFFPAIHDAAKRRAHCWPIMVVGIVATPLVLILDPVFWLYPLAIAAYLAMLYSWACMPKPPSKSKSRTLIDTGKARLKNWLKPEPEPVPIPSN